MIYLHNEDYLTRVRHMPDRCVDVVITDPPYLHEKGGRGKMIRGESLDRDRFNMKELGDFGEEEINTFLSETRRLMERPQWFIFCSEKQLYFYIRWAVQNKMKYNILCWCKPLSVMNRERFSTNIEYVVRIYGNGCALNKLDLEAEPEKTRFYSKHQTLAQIRGADKKHPSQKPLELLFPFIELATEPGGIVFDPFLGSGSTAVACALSGRSCVGVEKTAEYYEVAKQRIGSETQETPEDDEWVL